MSNTIIYKTIKYCNNAISYLYGSRMNISYVMEYPKCGGTWVSDLLRSYLDISAQYGKSAFARKNAVIQRHELPQPYHCNPIIVIRDPRDMLVSFYFFELYRNRDFNKKLLKKIAFETTNSDTINLSRYIEYKLKYPHQSIPGFSFEHFIERWKKVINSHFVKYEDLQTDTMDELKKMLIYLGVEIDASRMEYAIEKCSFKNVSGGRNQGSHDPSAFRRKGIVGDWKNYFQSDLKRLVDMYLGETLVELKYELDHKWAETN